VNSPAEAKSSRQSAESASDRSRSRQQALHCSEFGSEMSGRTTEERLMNGRQRKWAMLGTAGTISGLTMLLLFRSIPIAAETATGVIVAVIVLKHLALAIIVGSPLAALFQNIKPKLRSHCPLAR
jgi:hypothetical protein